MVLVGFEKSVNFREGLERELGGENVEEETAKLTEHDRKET